MAKKLRIAQVAPLTESVPPRAQNGLEFVISWITEELVRRGHEVTLFAPADSITSAKLVSLLPTGTHNDVTRQEHAYFSTWNHALSASNANDFDIIHCHACEGTPFVPHIDTPIVQTLHHPASHDPLGRFLLTHTTYSEQLAPILNIASKVHFAAVSNNQLAAFKQLESLYFKNYTTVHNGIPVEQFTFNAKPQDYLLYLGYINKNKGADVAVRVAHKLGMKLILAGNNFGEEKFFEEHIKPYLGDKIQYVGPVNFEQKNELYKNAVAKLAPLLWDEPFGLTLAEAQACGTPVIAFRKGAAPEIVKDGVTGFIVDTEDEMCEAVKKLHTIDRAACRKNIEENFSIKKMVDDYEKYYQKIVAQK